MEDRALLVIGVHHGRHPAVSLRPTGQGAVDRQESVLLPVLFQRCQISGHSEAENGWLGASRSGPRVPGGSGRP